MRLKAKNKTNSHSNLGDGPDKKCGRESMVGLVVTDEFLIKSNHSKSFNFKVIRNWHEIFTNQIVDADSMQLNDCLWKEAWLKFCHHKWSENSNNNKNYSAFSWTSSSSCKITTISSSSSSSYPRVSSVCDASLIRFCHRRNTLTLRPSPTASWGQLHVSSAVDCRRRLPSEP